jgi:hypothetical protein
MGTRTRTPTTGLRTTTILTDGGVSCADGSTAKSAGPKACAGHGGVIGAKAAQSEPRLARDAVSRIPEVPPPATGSRLCNDGTMSTTIGPGACAKHGGISDGSTEFERHDGPIRARTPERPLCEPAHGDASCDE